MRRADVPRPVEPAGHRKGVTIVFADLVGSTALHERLDAESARRFMESYYRAMRGDVAPTSRCGSIRRCSSPPTTRLGSSRS